LSQPEEDKQGEAISPKNKGEVPKIESSESESGHLQAPGGAAQDQRRALAPSTSQMQGPNEAK